MRNYLILFLNYWLLKLIDWSHTSYNFFGYTLIQFSVPLELLN
jgi:hypothetical protein